MPILIPDHQLTALVDAAKRVTRVQQRHRNNVAREASVTNTTPARRQRIRDAVIDSTQEVDKAQHALLIACVEAGIGAPQPWRYGEKEYTNGTFGQRCPIAFPPPSNYKPG